jgi:hypothetical protein
MFKDINFYLTLVGLIIGFIGIYLAWHHRYPGKVTYVREGLISLFNDVVRSMPELAVTYEGEPVQSNLVILRGHLFNSGHKDFTPDMIDQPLSFDLPTGFKWLRASITSTSKGLKAESSIKDNLLSLQFDLNLFRCKEHISFEALVEVPDIKDSKELPAYRLNKALKINHRIADTRSVDTIELPTNPKEVTLWKKSGTFAFLSYLIAFGLVLPIVSYFLDKPAEFEYTLNNNGKYFQAEVKPKSTGEVLIKSKDGKIQYTQTSEEFFGNRSWTAKAIATKRRFSTYRTVAVTLFLFGFLAVMELLEYRRSIKLYKLLNNTEIVN